MKMRPRIFNPEEQTSARSGGEAGRWAWFGVFLSLLVPGFGLVRAGRFRTGMLWFSGMLLFAVLLTVALIWRLVPTWLIAMFFIAGIVFQVLMLVASYKLGRMTFTRWLLFAALLGVFHTVNWSLRLAVQPFRVPTAAMEPTIQGSGEGEGDHILVNRLAYFIKQPERGDLLAFRTDGIAKIGTNSIFVKRVVGLPGETVNIIDGRIYVNGRIMTKEDGIPDIEYASGRGADPGPYKVPNDSYFVLGDNSARSADSRYWGCVPRHNLYGKVARIYYPFDRISVPE